MASSSKAIVESTTQQEKEDNPQQPEDFVAEPNQLDEQGTSWSKHVLIPAGKPFSHAYLGPLPDPTEPEEIKDFFPTYIKLRPKIFDAETPFHLDYLKDPDRVFNSPKVDAKDYKAWLDKIQAKKETTWKKQGILDIIQLSRYGPKYNTTLLLAAFQFWDMGTHSLHLKCGMLSPTLYDIAAITGLKPLGPTFDPELPVHHTFDFNNAQAKFSPYILNHHITDTEEVSDLEHIAFLTFWLSEFVFCSHPLEISKNYIPLAIQLHEGRNINLAKLLLGILHHAIDGAVIRLKEDKPTDRFFVNGPLWLFHLWLVATFEPRLGLSMPKEIRKSNPVFKTEGLRLAQLVNRQTQRLTHEGTFSVYFEILLNCDIFRESMAPFINCEHGPDWFKREFPSNSPEHSEENNQIWQAYLSPALLSTRIYPSNDREQLGISRYFPSYVSRQFGLCQLRPTPACVQKKEFNSPKTKRGYKLALQRFRFKDLKFNPTIFKPQYSCTKKFHDWWSAYYTATSASRTDPQLLNDLYSVLPSRLEVAKKEKAKGMHSLDIYVSFVIFEFLKI